MKCLNIYTNVIPSNIKNIRPVIGDLVCKLRDCCGDLEDSILFELRVVLSEMLVNAIRHGNREDENKTVKIRAGIVDDGNLFIIVEDEGSGYDFKNIWKRHKSCNETVSPLEIESCGRGTMIVRGLCDKVKVNAKGNKIVVLKNISKTH